MISSKKKAEYWAFSNYFDKATNLETQKLLKANNEKEIEDRFSTSLEFGTGGLRGIIGVGTNRINLYTIRRTTQAIANYFFQQKIKPLAIISYDNRRFSKEFARETAKVFAANKIQTKIFVSLTPTPILSFAIRYYKASMGVMITASHNPPNYNGYKAFQSDGSQIVSPTDKKIAEEIEKIEDYSSILIEDWEVLLKKKKIEFIPEDFFENYYNLVEKTCLGEKKKNENFGILYTPLHGTGGKPVLEIMKKRGFKKMRLLEEQKIPDENFSTLKSPNPEEISSMNLAIKLAKKEEELIIATDPDADRIGAVVKKNEKWHFINGNQIGALLLYFQLEKLKSLNKLPSNAAFITTIVTSPLLEKIAFSFGLKVFWGLTGFKNIAAIIREMEKQNQWKFVFGCEESHGYLLSDEIRDKDGVMSAVFLAEVASNQKPYHLLELLTEIEKKYGYHQDLLLSFTLEGSSGKQKIEKIMQKLRENPSSVFSEKITTIKDYNDKKLVQKMKKENLYFSNSNVFCCYFADGARITARPSGTEPKIKFYLNLVYQKKEIADAKAEKYKKNIQDLMDKI